MSTNRLQDELFDCLEINAGIVERQKTALAALEDLKSLVAMDHYSITDSIDDIIRLLKGERGS